MSFRFFLPIALCVAACGDNLSPNFAPVVSDLEVTTAEDTPVMITVLASDPDDDPIEITLGAPEHGTLAGAPPAVTYTPEENYAGDDSIAVQVSDGELSATAIIVITVTPVNDAPVAHDDAFATSEDTALTVPQAMLLANDVEVDGQSLTVTEVSNAVSGTVALDGDDVVFTPDPEFEGEASYMYTISDGELTATATVTVTVGGVNDSPVAVDDTATTDEDVALIIDASTLVANDSDADGQTLIVTAAQNPQNGTVDLSGTTVTFTPDADFNGTASFEYMISDGLDTDTATVTITVTPVNDTPVAVDDIADTNEDTTAAIAITDLVGNDVDVDGDVLSLIMVQNPQNGTVTLTATAAEFTPDADFNGTASFEYVVSDGTATSVATVTVTVLPVNDAPVAQAQSVTTDMDMPVAITLVATDVDSGTLTYTVTSGPDNGVLSGTGANLIYTPNAGYAGNDTFTFSANDGALDSNIAQVDIVVINTNCGNGTVDAGEECDDGNTADNDGCSAACLNEVCGDGVVNNGIEVCDDGNTAAGDGCRADCRGTEACGDGWIDFAVGEECDDGNTTAGDGCDSMCLLDPFMSVPAQPISGTLSCTTNASNTGRKAAVDQLGRLYVVMNCGGEAHVTSSSDRGVTWSAPVSTGITNVTDVAIEGSAADTALVVARTSAGELLLARTADAGATWATPATILTGVADSEVSIDSYGNAVYISVRYGTGLRVLRNFASGVGLFDFVDLAQTNAFHEIIVDKISADVWSVSDDPTFRVRQSSDQAVSFGAESQPPGQAFFSDWTGSNGFLYTTGTVGGTDIDVIPMSNPSTSTSVNGLPAAPTGQVRAIDADALGNAYVVTQLGTGAVQLDRMTVGATVIDPADARSIAAAGSAPGVAALPSNNGALVVFTSGTTVYVAVEVY